LGIVVLFVGVVSDILTTSKLPNDDTGKKFESNTNFMKICERWGFKAWIGMEIFIIIVLEVIDLIFLKLPSFFSIAYGAFRVVAATRNFKIINDYQKVGIAAFRKDNERRRQYFAYFLICIVAFVVIPVIAYMFKVNLFLTLSIEGLILGMGVAFFRIYHLTH